MKLDVLADAGYAYARYTGSCAPDGATVMEEPRTCGALFTRSVTEVKPSPPPLSASRAPTPVPEPRRPLEPPPPPINAGGESNPPEGVGGDRPDKNPVERGPLSGATPTVIAKDAVRKTLNIFRDGHTRMLEDEIRRVYPGVPPSIRQQFYQQCSKSLEYVFTSEPEYPELNLRSGHATVVIGVKREFETKVGSKPKPDEGRATFKLHRLGPDSDEWTINNMRSGRSDAARPTPCRHLQTLCTRWCSAAAIHCRAPRCAAEAEFLPDVLVPVSLQNLQHLAAQADRRAHHR